ncbi:o-succinylbenzoate synthase [uncultured Duncaniella sp.]|uniref:o-succinylbenzoate synthase n=3 Tax=Muribaculaceae TaxID=2005473 RepID=UPI0025B64163|nr:o-succinylbenzoate synthase [uncultured Duncaniella sp.]
MKATWCKYRLDFRFTAITSREQMRQKDTYYIRLADSESDNICGLGEAGLFRGLSCDDRPDYEQKLAEVCENIDRYAARPSLLADWPSIRFAVETAVRDLSNGGRRIICPSPWTAGKETIVINGLVWMGDSNLMRERIATKLAEGFGCVKIKIGGINFDDEVGLLRFIRQEAPGIQLRLDANGAFTPANALDRLNRLAEFDIHSLEQPIKAGQWTEMRNICQSSPIPIALDEELIGITTKARKEMMLDEIRPQFIVLKPTLTGGIESSEEWIRLAGERGCGWWVTSALESNIGLNTIAQWTATLDSKMAQGLGTGQLYDNNIPSPLTLHGERLSYSPEDEWEIPPLQWH